jgi:molybdopterin molybdotransferase
VEYTNETMPGTVEVLRPIALGGGVVQADDDVTPGAVLTPAGRPLRAMDLGMLAAAGVTEVLMHARPRVAILSTGDEVVAPTTTTLRPGQVRDAIAPALAGLVLEAGGWPVPCGIVPDDPAALRSALQTALAQADLVVVSAGSSGGDSRRHRRRRRQSGKPGIFCHGLAIRPGEPILLAECDGAPVIGLPGNPLSALLVFRLVGTRWCGALRAAPHRRPNRR